MSGDFNQMARSQQLMLQTIQQKHPELSGYLYRLSRSSFYLYLAQQCDGSGTAIKTLTWLWQAVKADPITPLVRLGWYLLLVKNLLKLTGESRQGSKLSALWVSHRLPLEDGLTKETLRSPQRSLPLTIHPLKIWLKVLVGTVLHQSLAKI